MLYCVNGQVSFNLVILARSGVLFSIVHAFVQIWLSHVGLPPNSPQCWRRLLLSCPPLSSLVIFALFRGKEWAFCVWRIFSFKKPIIVKRFLASHSHQGYLLLISRVFLFFYVFILSDRILKRFIWNESRIQAVILIIRVFWVSSLSNVCVLSMHRCLFLRRCHNSWLDRVSDHAHLSRLKIHGSVWVHFTWQLHIHVPILVHCAIWRPFIHSFLVHLFLRHFQEFIFKHFSLLYHLAASKVFEMEACDGQNGHKVKYYGQK